MNFQEIAALISVRQLAYNVLDNPSIKVSKDQLRGLNAKLSAMDNMIVSSIVSMDLEQKPVAPAPQMPAPAPAPPAQPLAPAPPPPPVGAPVAIQTPVIPVTETVTKTVPATQEVTATTTEAAAPIKEVTVKRSPVFRRST